MPASQQHIDASTPMGANLVGNGATFRVWAPAADHAYVALGGAAGHQPTQVDELVKDPATGHWTGFFPGVVDGTKYRFFVAGSGGSGFKRDPWARELELYGYPDCDGIVRDPAKCDRERAGGARRRQSSPASSPDAVALPRLEWALMIGQSIKTIQRVVSVLVSVPYRGGTGTSVTLSPTAVSQRPGTARSREPVSDLLERPKVVRPRMIPLSHHRPYGQEDEPKQSQSHRQHHPVHTLGVPSPRRHL